MKRVEKIREENKKISSIINKLFSEIKQTKKEKQIEQNKETDQTNK